MAHIVHRCRTDEHRIRSFIDCIFAQFAPRLTAPALVQRIFSDLNITQARDIFVPHNVVKSGISSRGDSSDSTFDC